MKILFAAVAATALVAIAAPASAQTYGSLGYSHIEADDVNLGAITGRIGHRMGSFFGIEAEASVGVQDDTVAVGATNVGVDLDYSYAGYLTGSVPVTPNLEVKGRVGYGQTRIEASAAGVSSAGKTDSLNYGVGAQYNWGQNGVRADWTRHDFRGNNAGEADAWTVSFVRQF